jgi:hypothetical protein
MPERSTEAIQFPDHDHVELAPANSGNSLVCKTSRIGAPSANDGWSEDPRKPPGWQCLRPIPVHTCQPAPCSDRPFTSDSSISSVHHGWLSPEIPAVSSFIKLKY